MLIAKNPCKLKCLNVWYLLSMLVLVAEETSLLMVVTVSKRSYQRLLQYPVLPAAVLLLDPPALPWLLSLA